MRSQGRLLALALVLVLCSLACTETDEQLIDDIGVTRLFLTDPALAFQSVSDSNYGPQWAQWKLDRAEMDIGGVVVDLVFGETCTVSDTVLISPFLEGACSGGIVVDSGITTVSLTLEIDSFTLGRAEPVDLSGVDYDGDGVRNDEDGSGSHSDNPCGLNGTPVNCDDNCPLIWNDDQTDTNEDGIGSACSTVDPFTGTQIADSDGDGVSDNFDNCVWIANPSQEDTLGLAADEIPDLIGDACVEQERDVIIAATEIVLDPIVFDQALNSTSFLVVDFSSASGRAVTCDFPAFSSCTLDQSAVRFCSATSLAQAVQGCPDP